MESQHRHPMQPTSYTRNINGYHSRRISSCSSGSATSSNSNYASSEDNMFVHRHLDNNNIPKNIDNRYQHGSHDNKAYRHEELGRPFSVISSDGEVAEIERDSNHVRQVSHRLRGTFCVNCNDGSYRLGGSYCQSCSNSSEYSPSGSLNQSEFYNSNKYHSNRDTSAQLELCSRDIDGNIPCKNNQLNAQGELMHGRPLPLTPDGELMADRNGANTPLRYQNDSPFIARTVNDSETNQDTKRLTLSSSAQPQQSAAEKQKSTEELLRQVPWFKPKMSREQVLENLAREDLGAFIIRESTTHQACFALSVKVPKFNNPTGIAHYIIHRTPSQGFQLKGLEKEWTNLSSLVIHHTIMPELLPCTLKIPRPVSSRRHSSGSRTSNSSRGSSASPNPLPISDTQKVGNSSTQVDRLAQGLEKKLNVTNFKGAV